MIFVEELSLWKYISIINKNDRVIFSRKSMAQKIFSRFLPIKWSESKIEKCDFHLVEYTTHIRKTAYDNAFQLLESINVSKWTTMVGQLFSIDFNLIWKKYLFDELYNKYEFIEIAKKYKSDFPNENCSITVQDKYCGKYKSDLREFESSIFIKDFNFLFFIAGILLIPFVIYYYYKNFRSSTDKVYNNQIVCLVDDHSTLKMFSEIFSDYPNLSFVTERHNVSSFTEAEREEIGLQVLGIDPGARREFRDLALKYMQIAFSNTALLFKHGLATFDILYLLMRGYGETIRGKGNAFVTYEHLVTVKAVRNELLASKGNISVFIPKNAYTASQYFHSELYINYTIMCAAGQHTVDLLQKKLAKTAIFLEAGSFDNHWGSVDKQGLAARLSKIQEFKGDNKLITIVSPGICDPTYKHEIKLMLLAKKLGQLPKTRVIIRTKPVQPISKYTTFYDPYIENEPNILLTNKEFELFDFLKDTDLFVTSISNAGSDLALAGGNVVFINFIKDNDMFLFWRKIPNIVVEEEDAFLRIRNYLMNHENSDEQIVAKSNKELVDYLGYRFNSFKDYRNNLIAQLSQYLPKESKVKSN